MLSKGSLIELSWQLRVLAWNALTKDELGYFLAERVAVVLEDVIVFRLVLIRHVAQQIVEDLFRHFSLSKRDYFCWLTCGQKT